MKKLTQSALALTVIGSLILAGFGCSSDSADSSKKKAKTESKSDY